MLGCVSCNWFEKKDPEPVEPELPAETQEGKNTIGFLADGVIWVPKGAINVPKFEISYYQGDLYLRAYNVDSEDFALDIKISGTGTYPIVPDSIGTNAAFGRYEIDEMHTGELIITKLDTVQRIISGTFYFDAVYRNDVVQITEGRFDFQY
jgi:hypothetical protein